ncbi:hypothetical protein J6590_036286 [Homalodisca vitripennis]|nr:hypothetical protein J6590_036286 [Homalodisca vitripennis]
MDFDFYSCITHQNSWESLIRDSAVEKIQGLIYQIIHQLSDILHSTSVTRYPPLINRDKDDKVIPTSPYLLTHILQPKAYSLINTSDNN